MGATIVATKVFSQTSTSIVEISIIASNDISAVKKCSYLFNRVATTTDRKVSEVNRAYSFSNVTSKIHHGLGFQCGSRHVVPAFVSHTSVIFGCDTKLVCDTNTNTCDCNY